MRGRSTAALSVALALWGGLSAARADDNGWSPASAPPAVVRARRVVASTEPAAVTLGRPVASAPAAAVRDERVRPAAHRAIATAGTRPRYRGQAPDAVPPPSSSVVPPPPPPFVTDPYGGAAIAGPVTGGNGWFQDRVWHPLQDSFNRRAGQPFQSDHGGDFDWFASPVSSPFLSEDPRSLTEVRPIFIYQSIPDSNPAFRGGSTEFFGLQARLALTERWSIVMNKLGGIAIQPDTDPLFPDETGFAEVWLGPKYTFYRDDCNNTVAALGLTFQIPVGSRDVFQDTGDLSLSPYVSFAKTFGKIPNGFGNFNFMNTTGFAFGTGSSRSNYFYSNFHLDFDVGGQHKLYPLVELNWVRYTNDGNERPFTFEGTDLYNFGSRFIEEDNLLTLAAGARYKFTESMQFGGAFEFPLNDKDHLFDFRFTLDLILRY